MKEIGGYFELELPSIQCDFIHSGCVMVNSGRHALEYILRALGTKVRRVLLPYYTCEVMLQPIRKLNLLYDFYHINEDLEIAETPDINEDDYIIVNNYFGIKDGYVNLMAAKYGSHLIIDNAQAWYAPEIPGIKAFYSPRKFFGLPDGGCVFSTLLIEETLDRDESVVRCSHLLKRIDVNAGAGYDDFRGNSSLLRNEPLKWMSNLTYRLLSSIDFELAKIKRKTNYQILDDALAHSNKLRLPDSGSFACPMVYPYLAEDTSLRKKLIDNKIFVATYWPNVFEWCSKGSTEYELAKSILPLPIDQRYDSCDMERIIKIINDGSNN